MRREWLLLGATATVTLVLSLGLIRWLAPALLGVPSDLQLVQVSREVPPFFAGVFRAEDYASDEWMLQDPRTRVRAKPLLQDMDFFGPHDVLGFRNRGIPNVADVVVIGDSQTYGNNAALEENWPSHLRQSLGTRDPVVYAMAAGGWGAVQYLDMLNNALTLQPRVVVVALYSGNDPLDSFAMAYGSPLWSELRPDPSLSAGDAPAPPWPPQESDMWTARFADGSATQFTPGLRLAASGAHPAVDAGWAIMADAAARMTRRARASGTPVLFTVIPTKELVYADRVARDGLRPPPEYAELVQAESRRIAELERAIRALAGATYADVVAPLRTAALSDTDLYPRDGNGHPVASGYRVIGEAIAGAVGPALPARPLGLVAVRRGENQYQIYLARAGEAWLFPSLDLLRQNGWSPEQVKLVEPRDLAGLARGRVETVDPGRFGPEATGERDRNGGDREVQAAPALSVAAQGR
jgi:lysophospholipase L1-like esterase